MLQTLFFDDFPPWEKEYLLPFASRLSRTLDGKMDVVDGARPFRPQSSEALWIIARDWKRAIRRLPRKYSLARVYVSILHNELAGESAFYTFWKRFAPRLPSNVTLVTHNPMTMRYLLEMDRVPIQQVIDLPLPFADFVQFGPRTSTRSDVVGTLTHLDINANLNFIVLVAHRILSQNPKLRFRVLGDGPLRTHLSRMAGLMDLGPRFEIVPTARLIDIVHWDAFLYAPLRCDHLIAPLVGIAAEVPTVCMETPGLVEWFQGLAVPCTPLFDCEYLASSVEDVLYKTPERSHNIVTLNKGLGERLDWGRVALNYAKAFGMPEGFELNRAVA